MTADKSGRGRGNEPLRHNAAAGAADGLRWAFLARSGSAAAGPRPAHLARMLKTLLAVELWL